MSAFALWLDEDGTTALNTFTYSYDAASQLTTAADLNSAYAYAYNNLGRLASVDNAGTLGLPNFVMTFGYDLAGRRTSISDSLNGGVTFTFDALHRMTSAAMVLPTGPTPQAVFTHNALDLVATVSRRVGTSGPTIETANTFDALGRLTMIVHTSSANGPLSEFYYSYDAHSRLTSYTGPDGSVTYNYDQTDQLTGVTGDRAEDFQHDANGNRTMSGYVVGDDNQILSDGIWNYAYDHEGNRVSQTHIVTGETRAYSWDHRNRLTGVIIRNAQSVITTEDRFSYDVHDRLIRRNLDATGSGSFVDLFTVYDTASLPTVGRMMDNVYADFDGAGSLATRYLYGQAIDQLMARLGVAGNDPAFYLTDNVGSVRQVADVNGVVLNDLFFSAFGQRSETNPLNGDRFGWQGREHEIALGIIQMRARWLPEGWNQFLSKDPIGFTAGDMNDRRLVGNHPTYAIDPSGLAQKRLDVDLGHIQRGFTLGIDRGSEIYGGFEIHIYRKGEEIAKMTGHGGFCKRHGTLKLPYSASAFKEAFPEIKLEIDKVAKQQARIAAENGWRRNSVVAGRISKGGAVGAVAVGISLGLSTGESLAAVAEGGNYQKLMEALQISNTHTAINRADYFASLIAETFARPVILLGGDFGRTHGRKPSWSITACDVNVPQKMLLNKVPQCQIP